MSIPQQTNIDLTQLPVQALSQLQARLSQDLEHLSASHGKLRAAQARFRDCVRCIDSSSSIPSSSSSSMVANDDILEQSAPPLLIPLTTSLYVPAKPSPQKNLLIDIGTGYYISKTPEQAKTYYEVKVKDLNESLSGIERVVGVKSGDLRVVEDVLREKVLAGQQEQAQQQQQQQGKEKEKRSTKT